MIKSIQSHFEGTIGDALASEIASKSLGHFRLSGMNSNLTVCQAMLDESSRAGVKSLLTIKNLEVLKKIRNSNIEWDNEPDGDIRPKNQHRIFMEAYDICKTNNNILHGPTISNLDVDSQNWLKAFMFYGVPKDVIITYHHYTPDVFFWQAHKGFTSRQQEFNAFRSIVPNHRVACSESGYNDCDERRQLNNVELELEFARVNGLEFWTYYQINDDPNIPDHFGARRSNLTWKPVIEAFAS